MEKMLYIQKLIRSAKLGMLCFVLFGCSSGDNPFGKARFDPNKGGGCPYPEFAPLSAVTSGAGIVTNSAGVPFSVPQPSGISPDLFVFAESNLTCSQLKIESSVQGVTWTCREETNGTSFWGDIQTSSTAAAMILNNPSTALMVRALDDADCVLLQSTN